MSTEKKVVSNKKPSISLKDHYLNARTFFKEILAELKKVQWPTRKQAMGETLVVLIVVIFITGLIVFYDFILGIVFNFIYQR